MEDPTINYEPENIEGESNRERFVRLVNFRLEKTVRRIRQMGNLSSKSNYEYSQDDVDFIRNALVLEIDEMLARFNSKAEDKAFPTLEG